MQKVDVQLFNSFPEILSNVAGEVSFKFDNYQPNTSGKLYTFYNNPRENGYLEPGDTVICQVKNTMAVGVVRAMCVDDITDREFFIATLKRSEKVRNCYRLILAKVSTETLGMQFKFKHNYERRKLENETKPKIDWDAFNHAIDDH